MKFSVSRNMPHPKTAVWGLLENYGDVHKINPLLRDSFIVGDKEKGVGAVRECRFYDGTSVREEVVEWSSGQRLKLRLFGGTMPIISGCGTLTVQETKTGGTVLKADVEMIMKYGPLGSLMGLIMKALMTAKFEKVLKSYDDHLSTGKWIGKNGILLDPA